MCLIQCGHFLYIHRKEKISAFLRNEKFFYIDIQTQKSRSTKHQLFCTDTENHQINITEPVNNVCFLFSTPNIFLLFSTSQLAFRRFPLKIQHNLQKTFCLATEKRKSTLCRIELKFNGVNCLLRPGKHRENIWFKKQNETQPNYSIDDYICLISCLIYFLCGNKRGGGIEPCIVWLNSVKRKSTELCEGHLWV